MVHSYFDSKLTQPDIDSSSSSDCENSDNNLDNIINNLLANLSLYKSDEQENMTIKKYKKDRNKHERSSENDKSSENKIRNSNHYNFGASAVPTQNEQASLFSLPRRQVQPIDNHIYPDMRLSQPTNPKRSRSLLPSNDSINKPPAFEVNNYKPVDKSFGESSGNNSEDEYYMATGSHSNKIPCQIEENQMSILLKEKKGWKIISVDSDGACLFRAVAHQIFGNEEEHKMIREQVINYMKKNREHFSQFISEDFDRYLLRKLDPHTHGNHVEIQAISELYNRPVEIYFNSLEPINVFHRQCSRDLPPIRLSYHGGIHYNSIVDPQNPTFGEGLGMPNYQPRLSESELLKKAQLESEQCEIEEAILQDKLKQSEYIDLERSIAEQVARQSQIEYLQSLKAKKICKKSDSFNDIPSPPNSISPGPPNCSTVQPVSSISVDWSCDKPTSIICDSRKRNAESDKDFKNSGVSSIAACSSSSSFGIQSPQHKSALIQTSQHHSKGCELLASSSTSNNYSSPLLNHQSDNSQKNEPDDYLLRHVPTNMLDMDEEAILAMVMENSRQEYINSHKKH